MAKLGPEITYSQIFMKTPEELRGALVEVLRNGELDRDLANFIADMLERKTEKKTEYKLIVKRGRAGNPTQSNILSDVMRCMDELEAAGKKVTNRNILDYGSELDDLKTKNFGDLSEEIIRKRRKEIEEYERHRWEE
jgi:hypothetical protein